jgi:hypothetical protein
MQKNNTSGTKKVFYKGVINGKKCSKSFAVNKYGEDSYNLACEWRENKMKQVYKHISK